MWRKGRAGWGQQASLWMDKRSPAVCRVLGRESRVAPAGGGLMGWTGAEGQGGGRTENLPA